MRFVAGLALGVVVGVVAMRAAVPADVPEPEEVVPEPVPEVEAPPPEPSYPPYYTVELDGADVATDRRVALVDMMPLVGRQQVVEVVYDHDAVTRPTTFKALRQTPEWQVGVRLALGEMGAWRLRDSRWGVLEAVGMFETVNNRLDPDLANPLREPSADWPGCGKGGTFSSCVDPGQYYGLNSDRALRPRAVTPAETLDAGVQVAVAAWFVYEEALLGEITAGATSFCHLCGGRGYGRPYDQCSGSGDDAARGPIVFRGPSTWLKSQKRYSLSPLAVVDFEVGPKPTASKAYVDYLLHADATTYADAATRTSHRR